MAASRKVTKYVFITGGVLSGLGKGITAASIANILKARGLKVTMQKCDPYLNVDAGTLNPAEHGECFVTKDGAETDLDLGHYERFLDEEMTQASSLMSGKVLLKLIQDERAGKFLGKTVQVIPHLTNAIQEYIIEAGEYSDVHIVEIGGTVGDYESPAFIEAIRELAMKQGRDNVAFIHLVYVPFIGTSREFKTKPAQNAVRDLRATGIVPDMLVVRSEKPAPDYIKQKLSMYCGVEPNAIALISNAATVYAIPQILEQIGWGDYIIKRLGIRRKKRPDFSAWDKMVDRAINNGHKRVSVALVAKYLDNEDTYMSVIEALKSAAWANNVSLNYEWVNAEELTTRNVVHKLHDFDGIVVPGGFGSRGVDGMIAAAQYAIEAKVPYLGLCLGMQVGVIAQARQVGFKNANTTEVDPQTPYPIFTTIDGQADKLGTGGTMRLGNYDCRLSSGSLARKLYGEPVITERHRHRYEFNAAEYKTALEEGGMLFSGINPETGLVEIAEKREHPFFIGSQFHPEFRSRPLSPHPMFDGFVSILKKRSK